MVNPVKIALIGLDTSHSVELPKLMQDKSVQEDFQVPQMRAVSCLRFDTPFQNTDGLNKRQEYLESIGVKVTLDFEEAVADCDGIMLTINDASYHRKYFELAAKLGKPIFMDKPMTDSLDNANAIAAAAKENNVRWCTASSLRFDNDLVNALKSGINAKEALVWGPYNRAPAGSSILWYGVHTFEILERIMGRGAVTVTASPDREGYVFHVAYADGRRGVLSMVNSCYRYGGVIRDRSAKEQLFQCTCKIPFYVMMLRELVGFFQGGKAPVEFDESYEILSMLMAAERSAVSGRPEAVFTR